MFTREEYHYISLTCITELCNLGVERQPFAVTIENQESKYFHLSKQMPHPTYFGFELNWRTRNFLAGHYRQAIKVKKI